MRYDPAQAMAGLTGRPPGDVLVVAQLGQSLDGRIATPTGQSKYISGRAALAHLHRLRAAVDAVVVGVDTVIADDPQLTVRLVDGDSPTRVIIDPSGRLPADRVCVTRTSSAGAPPQTILIRAEDVSGAAVGPAPSRGLTEIRLPRRGDGAIAPCAIVGALAARGLPRILIEGGARTLSHAIDEGCVDLLHVTVSPVILGSGTPGLTLPPIDALEDGLHPTAGVFAFEDGDALFACDLRRRRASAFGLHASPEKPLAEAAE